MLRCRTQAFSLVAARSSAALGQSPFVINQITDVSGEIPDQMRREIFCFIITIGRSQWGDWLFGDLQHNRFAVEIRSSSIGATFSD